MGGKRFLVEQVTAHKWYQQQDKDQGRSKLDHRQVKGKDRKNHRQYHDVHRW